MSSGESTSEKARVFSAPLVMLIGIAFLCGLYDKGLNTGLPLYYEGLGYPATIGGTLVAIYTISSTITRIIGGQATDHFNHIRVIMVSMVLLLIGVVLPIIWDAFAVVVIARVFQGSGFALSANVISVLMQGLVPKGHLGEAVGLKGAGASLSVMFGAMIATFLLDDLGFHWYFFFYVALVVVSIACVLLFPHTSAYKRSAAEYLAVKQAAKKASEASGKPTAKKSALEVVKSYFIPEAFPYMGVFFAHRIVRGLCISFVLVYSRYAGVGSGAMFFLVAGIGTLVFRLFGGKFYDNASSWWLFPMVFIDVIGFALLVIFPGDFMFYIAAALYGSSIGTASPFLKTLTAKAVPKNHWGVAVGELFFAGDIGFAAGAFFGGMFLDGLGRAAFPQVALGYSIFSAIVTLIVLFIARGKGQAAEK